MRHSILLDRIVLGLVVRLDGPCISGGSLLTSWVKIIDGYSVLVKGRIRVVIRALDILLVKR